MPAQSDGGERHDAEKRATPARAPRKLPSGAATVAASAFPPFRIASTFGTDASGTRRMTVAVDIDQKPPIATPSSARPVIRMA